MKCGREQGGVSASELGVCPASIEEGLEGVHGGKNAGRSCWVVAGTFCGGEVQGSFARKYRNCGKCNFYIKVRMEEGINFRMPMVLLHMRESRSIDRGTIRSENPALSVKIPGRSGQ
ncbi:MAG: hypothetical protein P8013_12280 [Candidatus Sulfobium sp.]